jgi:hypothetical protein
LEIHSDMTAGGKNLGDYVTLLDFYTQVLPHIHGKVAESIRASQALTSINDGLGNELLIASYTNTELSI